ncbi:uncharacterized protein BJ171DRAFT_582415 [Polychytrium aggregatum]|uniref:uncharacterized protein n=1 Tax=Polychytrium aggregatum TaxID=110093 RepID=UPI0022FE6E6E|nr:uncharacterized protein BJ171DRAFT_582415 [Polychytrium aggregatum]KAI9204039.1 hypothetical protein BJ171DRAFT_582415 [Polychytrium aggregatum]
MASLTKKLGQLRQWTGEKIWRAQKTDTGDDFKRLEQETEVRRECIEKIADSYHLYWTTLEKRKESPLDKQKRLPIESVAGSMISFGSMLHEESSYGNVLIRVGEAYEQLAGTQMDFMNRVHESYRYHLQNVLEDIKEYQNQKRKLENRRLDFDAKLNKLQRSKKDIPHLEEEVRLAQAKYEESLENTSERMISLNSNEDEHMQQLLNYVDIEVGYYKKSLQIMEDLQRSLQSVPRSANPSQGTDSARYRRHSTQSDLSTHGQDSYSRKQNQTGSSLADTRKFGSSGSRLMQDSRQGSQAGSPRGSVASAPKVLKRVKCLYSFEGENSNELTMKKGDLIDVTGEIDEGWWEGNIQDGSGRFGMFPSNYVEVVEDAPSDRRLPPRPSTTVSVAESDSGSKSGYQAEPRTPTRLPHQDSEIAAPTASQNGPNMQRLYSSTSINNASTSSLGKASVASERPFQLPRSTSNVDVTKGACATCGCDEFVPHAFKTGQCTNCFHGH